MLAIPVGCWMRVAWCTPNLKLEDWWDSTWLQVTIKISSYLFHQVISKCCSIGIRLFYRTNEVVAIATLKSIQVSLLLKLEIFSPSKLWFAEQSEAPPGWKIFDYPSPAKVGNAKGVRKRLFSKSSKTMQIKSSQEMLTGRNKSSSIIVETTNLNRNSVAVSPDGKVSTVGNKIPQEQSRKQSIEGKSHARHNRLTGWTLFRRSFFFTFVWLDFNFVFRWWTKSEKAESSKLLFSEL